MGFFGGFFWFLTESNYATNINNLCPIDYQILSLNNRVDENVAAVLLLIGDC